MSNVINVCFKTRQIVAKQIKQIKSKVLTKSELNKISKRINEIEQAMDLCDSDRDADIFANLDLELAEILAKLRSSVAQLELNLNKLTAG